MLQQLNTSLGEPNWWCAISNAADNDKFTVTGNGVTINPSDDTTGDTITVTPWNPNDTTGNFPWIVPGTSTIYPWTPVPAVALPDERDERIRQLEERLKRIEEQQAASQEAKPAPVEVPPAETPVEDDEVDAARFKNIERK